MEKRKPRTRDVLSARSHATHACQACKSSKIRCLPGTEEGTCKRCEERGLACAWNREADGRTNRTDTKAYVRTLEARVAELEAQLAKRSRPASNGSANAPPKRPRAAQTPVPDSCGELKWYTATRALPGRPIDLPEQATQCYRFLPVPLSTDLHATLLNLAFKWRFIPWRGVEQTVFMDSMATRSRTRTYSPFLHLCVLAVGCLYMHDPPACLCSDPSDPATRGEPFIRAAMELFPSEIEAPHFSTIRGIIVLSHWLGTHEKPSAGWIYLGIACRICMDLGLMWDSPPDSGITEDLRWCRHRLFWTCFAHEVSWSLWFGKQSTFDLATIRQPLPLHEDVMPDGTLDLWNLEMSLSIFTWQMLKVNYSDRADEDEGSQKSRVKALLEELKDWYRSLPPEALLPDTDALESPSLFQLHLGYWLDILLLLKPFVPTTSTEDADAGLHAAQQCGQAAREIVLLVRRYQAGPGLRFASDHTYQAIFHAASYLLDVASAPGPTPLDLFSLLADVEVCITALRDHAETWQTALHCAKELEQRRNGLQREREEVA